MPTHQPAPAAASAPPSRRALGQMLKFSGLMLMAGASLALIRTREVADPTFFAGRPWFFLLLIPAGLAVYFVGFRLCARPAGSPPPTREASHG